MHIRGTLSDIVVKRPKDGTPFAIAIIDGFGLLVTDPKLAENLTHQIGTDVELGVQVVYKKGGDGAPKMPRFYVRSARLLKYETVALPAVQPNQVQSNQKEVN